MTTYYCAGFDLASPILDGFEMVFSKDGETDITVDAADIALAAGASKMFLRGRADSGIQTHDAWSSATTGWSAWASHTFTEALEDVLNAYSALNGWGVTFTVALVRVQTTGEPGIFLSILTTGEDNVYLNNLSDEAIRVTGYIGGCGPLNVGGYVNAPTQSNYIFVPNGCLPPSEVSDIYEENALASQAVPESGSEPYGMVRTKPICHYDFSVTYQPKVNTYTEISDIDSRFGADALFTHCRASSPFVMVLDAAAATGTLHYIRQSECKFVPKKVHPDFDDYWNIDFKTIYVGKVQLDEA
jgi:hypothetical protein